MKQPTIIVEGKRNTAVSIEWGTDGKLSEATAWVNGVYTFFRDVSKADGRESTGNVVYVELSKVLEFGSEKEDALIEHLDSVLEKEDKELTAIAIEAMEGDAEEPFALNLLDKQKEYKVAQTRVFGMIDAVEEVKAFLEGFYFEGGENK